MSKSQITQIRTIKMFSFTPTLIFWGCVIVFWTCLTSLVTYMTLQMNFGIPQHACEVSAFVQPMTIVEKIDKYEKSLVDKIVDNYNVPQHRAEEVVRIVRSYTENHKFPSQTLVLGLISVESSFKQNALSSKSAKGYMQITAASGKPHTYDVWTNLSNGIELLREYHKLTGSEAGAVQSYLLGVTAFKQGSRAPEYLAKVRQADKSFRG